MVGARLGCFSRSRVCCICFANIRFMLGPNSQLSKSVVMLKACRKAFSITKMPDFSESVYTKCSTSQLEVRGDPSLLARPSRNDSARLGVPVRHR